MSYPARSYPGRTHPGARRAFPPERRLASGLCFRLTAGVPGTPAVRGLRDALAGLAGRAGIWLAAGPGSAGDRHHLPAAPGQDGRRG